MAGLRSNGADRRQGRRWSFATCIFDENSWSLFVDGCRVPIEAKPLELLQELLLRPSEVVSKDELFDKIWPNVTVVEASLPTAVHKLRLAIGDDAHRHIIETVASIGYRLGVPVEIEYSPASPEPSAAIGTAAQNAVIQTLRSKFASVRFLSIAGGLGIAAAVSAFALGPAPRGSANKAPAQFSKRDVKSAVRKLDVDTIEKMLAAGWDPNMPLDAEDNGALNIVLGVCEWDRTRDAARMVLMVRTLIEGGAKLDHRNVWGDTPYSIAKAPRYCGPSHPVTKSIRATCFDGYKPLGDRCLASYERPRSPQPLRSKIAFVGLTRGATVDSKRSPASRYSSASVEGDRNEEGHFSSSFNADRRTPPRFTRPDSSSGRVRQRDHHTVRRRSAIGSRAPRRVLCEGPGQPMVPASIQCRMRGYCHGCEWPGF